MTLNRSLRHALWMVFMMACMQSSAAVELPIPESRKKRIQAAMPAKATAIPKKPRSVLIWITPAHLMPKDPHKGYCIPYGAYAMSTLGEKTGAFKPVVSDDLAMFLPERLTQFDAIVMNNSSGAWLTPTDRDMQREAFKKHGKDRQAVEAVLRQSLLDFVSAGGGIMAIHYAIGANRHWPRFQALLGATFTGHPWNEEIGITVEEPGHPLVQAFGGKNFRLADEIFQYGPPFDRRRVRVLLSVDTEHTNMKVKWLRRDDNDYALAWIKRHGRGRIFYTSFGHRTEIYWHPAILRFYLDAIQFAAGDLEAPAASRSAQTP